MPRSRGGRVYAVYNMYADRSVLYEGVVKSLFVVIILYIFIVIITVKFHPRAIQYNILCTPPRAYILKFKNKTEAQEFKTLQCMHINLYA